MEVMDSRQREIVGYVLRQLPPNLCNIVLEGNYFVTSMVGAKSQQYYILIDFETEN